VQDSARGVPWNEWIRTVESEPSLYAADFSRLGEQIDVLLRTGARVFHFDVGDGHFVPPITIGPIVLRSISEQIHRVGGAIDVHMMTEAPERHLAAVAEAGGDSVTVHFEACDDVPAVVRAAREQELQVGLAFKPETAVADVAAAAGDVDLVLCMSIEPGYSGQEYMPEATARVRELRELLPADKHIQVDGGLGAENVREVYEAGATLLVAGTSIFEREDLPRAYRRLVQALA
jgi:ribulose-phosphate 3-epimerase